jgi:3-deoxy-manno-octulosonate cytidylyltransferase (CMP-KDO synthetase)
MKTVGVIPCRYQSSRFPGKPLASINDMPMMWHVYQRALESNILDEVYIATDDIRIQDVAKKLNLRVVMTSDNHSTGTDRVAQVASMISADYYVNIQGDEPMIDPKAIYKTTLEIVNCNNPLIHATNAYTSIKVISDVIDSNIVKVVMDTNDQALAYSRQPIPYPKSGTAQFNKQLGLYAFKKSGLQVFSEISAAYLEKTESVEMYRLLEHGYGIKMVHTVDSSLSVDTPYDLERVQKLMMNA